MKIRTVGFVIVMAFIIGACTTVPTRFTQTPEISPYGGYFIEAEDANGFYMEIFYKSYSFLPIADDNIQEAKEYFIEIAYHLANERKKIIKPILKSQLRTESTRNIVDGYYAINVFGRVDFKP